MEFQARHLALFLLFSVTDGFEWFWMECIHKNIQLMLEFIKAQGSYYTLMTFLMMLSVIFLSMLIILLSIIIAIRDLICGNNFNWFLNLNLIYETLWVVVRSGLLISMLGELRWFSLTSLITMVLLMWKWMCLKKKSSFKMLGLNFFSKLDWGSYIIPLAKTASKKIGALIPWSFFLLRLLFISINLRYVHLWNPVVTSGLVPLVASFSFYQHSEKPKGIGFLETLKNPIYLKIILIIPEILSPKLKTKRMVELVITNNITTLPQIQWMKLKYV